MFRRLRRFIRFCISLAIICLAVWYGLKFYFSYVQPIAPQVRKDVELRVASVGGRQMTFAQLPKTYREAVVAVEDKTFFQNIGIDFEGIGRAIIVDLTRNGILQGGSTITQQLVHNTVLANSSKSFSWKIQEMVYAVGLYDTMSKRETLALYANDIYFGHGAYGLYNASEVYFGTLPGNLNDGELTMLAGLPNAPSDYDPYLHYALARARQTIVVQSMVNAGLITSLEGTKILAEPIRLKG